MVEMGTDRIHHGFWRFTDSEHRLYEPGNPYEHAMLDYYRRLDAKIARLLRLRRRRHGGARRLRPRREADGRRRSASTSGCAARATSCSSEEPSEPTRLTPDLIDWSRTVAWGEGGYYSRLFLNVEGREPEGVVSPDDYERVRSELKSGSRRSATTRAGRSARSRTGRRTCTPKRRGSRRTSRLLRRPLLAQRRQVGDGGGARVRERHRPRRREPRARGAVRARGGRRAGRAGPQRALHDVAPTLLELLGEPVPAR